MKLNYQFLLYCLLRANLSAGLLWKFCENNDWGKTSYSRWKNHGVPPRAWTALKKDLRIRNLTFYGDSPLYFDDLKKEYEEINMPTHYGAIQIKEIVKKEKEIVTN